MTKKEMAKKKPSRVKYEKEHPTLSFRVDKETYQNLTEHLQNTGASFADFVKDNLEKEQKKVAERVETLASQKVGSLAEERVKALEILVSEIITTIASIPGDRLGRDFRCPRCPAIALTPCIGKGTSTGKYALMWACPTCDFITRGHEPVDPGFLYPFPAEKIISFVKGAYDVEELIRSLKRAKVKFPRLKPALQADKQAPE